MLIKPTYQTIATYLFDKENASTEKEAKSYDEQIDYLCDEIVENHKEYIKRFEININSYYKQIFIDVDYQDDGYNFYLNVMVTPSLVNPFCIQIEDTGENWELFENYTLNKTGDYSYNNFITGKIIDILKKEIKYKIL